MRNYNDCLCTSYSGRGRNRIPIMVLGRIDTRYKNLKTSKEPGVGAPESFVTSVESTRSK